MSEYEIEEGKDVYSVSTSQETSCVLNPKIACMWCILEY